MDLFGGTVRHLTEYQQRCALQLPAEAVRFMRLDSKFNALRFQQSEESARDEIRQIDRRDCLKLGCQTIVSASQYQLQ